MVCEWCGGQGARDEVYDWSDGPGIVRARCQLCNGTGETEDHRGLLRRLVKAEQERAASQSELDRLRTYCGLYFDALEGNKRTFPPEVPDPVKGPGYIIPNEYGSGYVLATRPASQPDVWEERLRAAGSLAPRYTGKLNDFLRSRA